MYWLACLTCSSFPHFIHVFSVREDFVSTLFRPPSAFWTHELASRSRCSAFPGPLGVVARSKRNCTGDSPGGGILHDFDFFPRQAVEAIDAVVDFRFPCPAILAAGRQAFLHQRLNRG